MENSFGKNAAWRLPFGEFQARISEANQTSAPMHSATVLTPPPLRGQLAEPRIPFGPRLNYGQVYTSDHSSSSTFVQVPFESQRFCSVPQARPFAGAAAQFQPRHRSDVGGEFQPSSWNVNVNVPPPTVNVNVPPPPSANTNMPPLPPINRNIPPPGFNPQVPPPPIFSPQCARTMVVSSTTASALRCSPLALAAAPQPSSFTSRPQVAGAAVPRFGVPLRPVPSFINCQRMTSNNMNQPVANQSVVRYRPVHQPTDRGMSHSPSVPSSISTAPADKCADADGKPPSLSADVDSTHSPIDGTAGAATIESFVTESRRRRASTRCTITVSCNNMFLCDVVNRFYVHYCDCQNFIYLLCYLLRYLW